MSGGIEKKGKEDLGVGVGHTFKDGEEMGAGGAKFSPGESSSSAGISEPLTLASCKVDKGAWGLCCAPWHLTMSRWVTTPISSEPAGSITATGHPELHSCLLDLILGTGAGGEQW